MSNRIQIKTIRLEDVNKKIIVFSHKLIPEKTLI